MDIVEKLKLSPKNSLIPYKYAMEAVDEIEHLRKKLNKIAPAIVRVAMEIDDIHDIVREALKEKE